MAMAMTMKTTSLVKVGITMSDKGHDDQIRYDPDIEQLSASIAQLIEASGQQKQKVSPPKGVAPSTKMQELHEITMISDHKRCFSKSTFDITDVACTCKVDTVETRIVGTESYRNWQFSKGRVPFKIGQQVTLADLNTARSLGAIREVEEKREKIKQKAQGA